MSTARQGASVLATRLSQIALALILSVIVNRLIGPENRGLLELLTTIPVLIANTTNLGMGNACLYFLGKKIYPERQIIANAFSSTVLVSGIMILLLCTAYLAVPSSIFEGVSAKFFLIALAMIPLLLMSKVFNYILLGKGKLYLLNRLQILSSILNAALVLVLVFWLRMDVTGALLAILATNVLITGVYLYVAIEGGGLSLTFSWPFFREALRFGIIPFLALAVMNLIFRSDVFLIKHFLSDTELGYYGLGVSLCERIWILPESIGLVILAKAAHAMGDDSVASTARVCRLTLWLTVTGSMLLFVLAPFLIPALYGAPYAPAVLPLQILLPGIAMIAVFLVLHSDLAGRGEAKCTLYVFAVFLVVNVLLNLFLIPRLGIAGSAFASSVSYAGGAFTLAVAYARKYRISVGDLFLVNKEDWRQIIAPLLRKALGSVLPMRWAIKIIGE